MSQSACIDDAFLFLIQSVRFTNSSSIEIVLDAE